MPRIQQFQFRRGTAAAWTSANPTLAAGEVGFETDTRLLKSGDGATAWTSLPYVSAGSQVVGSAPSAIGTGMTCSAPQMFTTTVVTTLVQGVMYAVPLFLSRPAVITGLLLKTGTAASAGAALRFGVCTDTGAFSPGSFVYDSGAKAATAGFGTVSSGAMTLLTSAPLVWLIAKQEGSPTTSVSTQVVTGVSNSMPAISTTATSVLSRGYTTSYRSAAVADGAFPASFTVATADIASSSATSAPLFAVTFA